MCNIVIIIAIVMFFYARTLDYGYVSDDIPTSQRPPSWKNKWHKLYLMLVALIRTKPWKDHLMQICLHASVCVMIYVAFGMNNVSFLAAMLFAVNPALNQGSIWISGRGYLLPGLCILIAMAVPFLAPLMLISTTYFIAGYVAPLALIGSPVWWLIFFAPVAWWVHYRKLEVAVEGKRNDETVAEDKVFHWGKLILFVKTFGFYLTLALFPFRVAFYHAFLQSCSGNEIMKKRAYSLCRFFWIGLTGIGLMAYGLFHWNLMFYGLWWFCVCIAPFCNLIRIQQEIAERYIYLAAIGLIVGLSSVLINYPFIAVALWAFYATRLWYVMPMYKDDFWLIEYSVMESPDAWYGWHIRGMKKWDQGSHREAVTMWVVARLISPKEFKVLFNLSTALRVLARGNPKMIAEADYFLKMAKENVIKGQEAEVENLWKDIKNGKYPILT